MKRRSLLLSLSVPLLAGCGGGNSSARSIALNESATITWGSRLVVAGEGVELTMVSVPEDTRCRPQMNCLPPSPVAVEPSGYRVEIVEAPLEGRGRTSPVPYWPVTIRVTKYP
jgi:hypothetical protein